MEQLDEYVNSLSDEQINEIEMRKKRVKELEGCMDKVYGLLEEMMEPAQPWYVDRNSHLAKQAAGLIEEIL